METLLIIILIVLVASTVLSGRASSQPQVIYIQTEPQVGGGVGCLLPLLFAGFVLLLLFAGR